MAQVVIENPILKSPYEEPRRHFRFTEEGITDEIIEERRVSQYFVPIPRPKKRKGAGKQLSFDTEWTADRIEENKNINRIREKVATSRKGLDILATKALPKSVGTVPFRGVKWLEQDWRCDQNRIRSTPEPERTGTQVVRGWIATKSCG
jgi:hypothetical protein